MIHKGFSLLELSIVLVIIGLLAGGVMVGQELMRQSELRGVITDLDKASTAVNAFKSKYSALPGDMKNAELYWGTAGVSDAACLIADSRTASPYNATCNGNGNGIIANTARSAEGYRFWQHLSAAGMYEGSFSGIRGSGTLGVSPDNSPAMKIAGAFWRITNLGVVDLANLVFYPGNYNNTMQGGRIANDASMDNDVPFLRAEEMYSIDIKRDDGQAASGIIVSRENRTQCITSTDPTVAAYLLTSTQEGCVFIFRNAF
jgi:prepilin-type N-terminal cleavage/methylation domain-containing protein